MIQVLANQRHAVADASVGITEHALVRLSCTKQHKPGVWGREGQSPLADREPSVEARGAQGAEPARIHTAK